MVATWLRAPEAIAAAASHFSPAWPQRIIQSMRTAIVTLASLGLFVVGSVGCMSAPQSQPRTFQTGDVTARPSVEALPSLDVAQTELTPEMRMAALLSAECLNLAPPVQPADMSTAALAAWSDQELKTWMQLKHGRAEAARKELDRAAEQNQRQRVMAGALVGLVYEDVARTLLALPVPSELSSEPEIAEMYVDLLRRQAAPYLLQAHQAYVACSGNAEQVDPLRHWSAFCGKREERLPTSGLDQLDLGATNARVVRK
jgi:hypothetical protein